MLGGYGCQLDIVANNKRLKNVMGMEYRIHRWSKIEAKKIITFFAKKSSFFYCEFLKSTMTVFDI